MSFISNFIFYSKNRALKALVSVPCMLVQAHPCCPAPPTPAVPWLSPPLPSTAGGQVRLTAVPAVWINCSLSLSTSPTPHLFFSYSLNPFWSDPESLTSTGACAQTVSGSRSLPPSRSPAPCDVSLRCLLLRIEFLLAKGRILQCCGNHGLHP